jgi:hypothetical protein
VPIGYDSTAATDGSGIARKKTPLSGFSKMIVDTKTRLETPTPYHSI